MEWQLIYEKAVPDVELINYLSFDSNYIASGGVVGFVVFDDKAKQQKDLRQYVEIQASNKFEGGKQVFYLTDIIKMNNLAPRYFDPVVLTAKDKSGDSITLSDTENNMYLINKYTKEITMFDATKDVSKLITNQTDFRNFVVNLLE